MKRRHDGDAGSRVALLAIGIVAVCIVPVLLLMGFFTIQPNQARVLILFGDYKGTVRDEGFHWANPFYSRNAGSTVDPQTGKPVGKSTKISLRARTYNGEHLKVNDKCGNPIEIADVIVWRVENTAKALFDVDDYNSYVHTQSETALRHVATTVTLRPDGREPRARSRCAATSKRCPRRSRRSWPCASRRPASSSTTRASRTWPTRRRSPRRCCAASRRTR